MSIFVFFKQKTAYELRISDWSSDVCSSDLEFHNTHLFEGAGPSLLAGLADRLPVGGKRPPASSVCWRKLVGCGAAQRALGMKDRTGAARPYGPDRNRLDALETDIALDPPSVRQADGGRSEAHTSDLQSIMRTP